MPTVHSRRSEAVEPPCEIIAGRGIPDVTETDELTRTPPGTVDQIECSANSPCRSAGRDLVFAETPATDAAVQRWSAMNSSPEV